MVQTRLGQDIVGAVCIGGVGSIAFDQVQVTLEY
jgi:hypothetical protein